MIEILAIENMVKSSRMDLESDIKEFELLEAKHEELSKLLKKIDHKDII